MKRILFLTLAFTLGLALLAGSAWAHGGSFKGPNGGVPPGLRDPSDPEPPPPPPSDPGGPGPHTPGEGPGPKTPPEGGHDTPGENPAPQPIPTPHGKPKRPTSSGVTFESWRFWWAYNNADILNLKTHIYASRSNTMSVTHFTSGADRENRLAANRPTRHAIQTLILPALQQSLDRPGEHDDIVGGDLVAIGKIGFARHIATFEAALHNRYQTDKGKRIKFGYQATESAALALGLLPTLDASEKAIVRRVCLDAIANDSLARRDRAWAAVSLGLQRDTEATRPLAALLDKRHRYVNDNIPAAILVGLGLIGDPSIREELERALTHGDLFGRDIKENERLRAFAGYALTKIGDPKSLPAVLTALRARSAEKTTKRSAAIAAGVLGAKSDADGKKEAVEALIRYMRKADPTGVNFATIALSQIGTEKALRHLLELAENGRYGQRPFAALGLATCVWYTDRAAAEKKGEPMARDLRDKIVQKLRRLANKFKDSDTRAAFLLCRGLVQDKAALGELTEIVASRSAAPVLRGYACVALGLIGDTREDVKDALRLALAERKSTDLRRNAATGLGLLRDARVVDDLLLQLRKARSFAVQGQLITAIGTIGDTRAVPPLIELLEDKSQPAQTRAMAAVGLGMIGDLNELPKLARLSKNYNYRASIKDVDELLFIL